MPFQPQLAIPHSKGYSCRLCTRLFKDLSSVNRHLRGHPKYEMPVNSSSSRPGKAPSRLPKPPPRQVVASRNEKEVSPRHFCVICRAHFEDLSALRGHNRHVHSEAALQRTRFVARERERKESSREKRYRCERCGFSSKSIPTLRDHMMKVHEETDVFFCPYCLIGFAKISDRNCHVRIAHEKKSAFQCNICNGMFKDKHVLERHLHNIHKKSVRDSSAYTEIKPGRNK